MTKERHNTMFGFLVLLCFIGVLSGFAWGAAVTIDWKLFWNAPAWVHMIVGSVVAAVVVTVIGKAIEPIR